MARMGGAAESEKVDRVVRKGNMELTALKDSSCFSASQIIYFRHEMVKVKKQINRIINEICAQETAHTYLI